MIFAIFAKKKDLLRMLGITGIDKVTEWTRSGQKKLLSLKKAKRSFTRQGPKRDSHGRFTKR